MFQYFTFLFSKIKFFIRINISKMVVDESFVGMEAYLTKGEGIGGKLKKNIEDFIVEEIPLNLERKSDGKNLFLKVKLRNWETNRFVIYLSKILNVPKNSIYFAGTKDKRAITTQYFCIMNYKNDLKIDIKDVEILEVFRSDKCIDLGDLFGNRFEIKVSDTNEKNGEKVEEILNELKKHGGFPNFFGIQRFGSSRPITHIVGKYIVQRKFDEAVKAYIGLSFDFDQNIMARKYFYETMDPDGTIDLIESPMDYEIMMLRYLQKKPEDYIGAINVLPRTLKMMFVHGYQGYIFNKILSRRIIDGYFSTLLPGDIVLPVDRYGLPINDRYIIVNEKNMDTIEKRIKEGKAYISGILFGSESKFSEGYMGEIERKIVEDEKIEGKMFDIREIKGIGSKGSRRAISSPFFDFSYSLLGNSFKFNFLLFKGTYATSLLREFMKRKEIQYY